MAPHRHAQHREIFPPSEVRLHEDAKRVALARDLDDARGRAIAGLEVIGQHAGAAAHTAHGDRARARGVQRCHRVLRRHVESVDVVQVAVIGLGRNRQAPVLPRADAAPDQPADGRIAGDAAGVRIGDGDGRLQLARFLDPHHAGHLAIAVEGVISGRTGHMRLCLAARQDGGDTGAHRPVPHPQGPLARDQRHLPHLDTRHVGNGVPPPRCSGKWQSKFPAPHSLAHWLFLPFVKIPSNLANFLAASKPSLFKSWPDKGRRNVRTAARP